MSEYEEIFRKNFYNKKKYKLFYDKKVKKKSKNIFYNNLGICSVIIYFTACLCITKNEKFSAFLRELYRSAQYFF